MLPALDESEADLLGVADLLGEEDHEDDAEVAVTQSLTDIMGDGELETVTPEHEGAVSLDELAVEENADGDPDDAVD
ncbi:MAG: hypothetical protein K8R88_09695 [Armatimonadetes bacterium]|nr:hypothetical protein [Armatimonadota bacterium]